MSPPNATRSDATRSDADPRVIRAKRLLNAGALACFGLWLVAAAGVPLLHGVGHRPDHIHLPNGAIVHVDPPADDGQAPREAPAAPRHGDGSLAHLSATAVHATSAPLSFVRTIERVVLLDPLTPPARPQPRWARPRSARAPPLA